MCDVAYVLQVEDLASHMNAVSGSLAGRGSDEALALPGDIRARFDADLLGDAESSVDASVMKLRKELGV